MKNDVSLGLAHEAEVTLRKCGATSRRFWDKIAKDLKLARQVVDLVQTELVTFGITVDYSRSFNDMLKAARISSPGNGISKEHFPIKGRGRHDLSITLFNFCRGVEQDEVIAEMDRRGYRPARIEELLAFAEKCDSSNMEYWMINRAVIALCPNCNGSVPFFQINDSIPYLGACSYYGSYSTAMWFAAIEKPELKSLVP
ncbi:hypothetical protein MYX07_02940 [Patescibacteria group bacterium AH-259-L07]|nr:hypothetical protein [Patescibacteria group bacterium AH-259-L07]